MPKRAPCTQRLPWKTHELRSMPRDAQCWAPSQEEDRAACLWEVLPAEHGNTWRLVPSGPLTDFQRPPKGCDPLPWAEVSLGSIGRNHPSCHFSAEFYLLCCADDRAQLGCARAQCYLQPASRWGFTWLCLLSAVVLDEASTFALLIKADRS